MCCFEFVEGVVDFGGDCVYVEVEGGDFFEVECWVDFVFVWGEVVDDVFDVVDVV